MLLDAELRAILCKEVSLEHVEIEFERVMKVVSPLGRRGNASEDGRPVEADVTVDRGRNRFH